MSLGLHGIHTVEIDVAPTRAEESFWLECESVRRSAPWLADEIIKGLCAARAHNTLADIHATTARGAEVVEAYLRLTEDAYRRGLLKTRAAPPAFSWLDIRNATTLT